MVTINRYYSLEGYLAHICASPYKWTTLPSMGREWSYGADEGSAYVRRGASDAEQRPVREMLSRIDAGVRQREKRELIATVAGGSVNVPDFLQGKPRCMRRRTMIESDVAPVKVIVEVGVSAGTGLHAIQTRGAAVAALVMRLGELRPVELWVAGLFIGGTRGDRNRLGENAVATLIRIDTAPISAALLTAVLVSQHFARGVIFSDNMNTNKTMPRDNNGLPFIVDAKARDKAGEIKRLLGLTEQDIVVPGGHLAEQSQIIRDPVAWVNKYLDPQREL